MTIPREQKRLTIEIANAIDEYQETHTDLTVAEIVISLLKVWQVLWSELSPRKPRKARTCIGVAEPPRVKDVISEA